MSFTNATKLPWFSTSAFPKASGCLWVDENQSSIVGEMAPGAKASVLVWAFVPERCSEPATLSLKLADTHRGAPSGSLTLSLKPTSWVRPHASKLRLDTDALGSSDGSRLAQLGPSLRFEAVADVRVSGDAISEVVSRWAVPTPVRSFFKSLMFRAAAMVPQGGGQFAAGDDLDGETVSPEEWAALAESSALERWMVAPATGRLWLAMDTTVVLSDPPPAPAVPPLTLPARRGRPATPTVSAPPSSSPSPPPLAATVAELVKQYVELTPHTVTRENPAAVKAVSGYELLFDRGGFMKAYEALLAPPPVPPAAIEVPTARYVTRTYLALPAAPISRAPPPPEPEAPPAPRPPPAPRADPTPRTWFQLDVGGGPSIFGVRPTSALENLWGHATVIAFPTLSARAFIGPSVVGVLAFQLATVTYELAGPATFTELSGDLGAGYRWTWDRLSLTPYAALLLRQRSHALIATDAGSIGAALGLNTRLRIASWFGVAIDVSVPLALGGPDGFVRGVDVPIVDGIGLRATAQLSISF